VWKNRVDVTQKRFGKTPGSNSGETRQEKPGVFEKKLHVTYPGALSGSVGGTQKTNPSIFLRGGCLSRHSEYPGIRGEKSWKPTETTETTEVTKRTKSKNVDGQVQKCRRAIKRELTKVRP
jgi:hypothetical protein